MNAEGLLAHYGRIADAPDAVARLRRFVLNLAVRGKLVPQDAGDERVLGVLKRQHVAFASHGAFDVPMSWVWVTVGAVAQTRLGKMLDKLKNKGEPRPYLRNLNVRWFDFDLSDLAEMRFEDAELGEFQLQCGDVLICEGGEPGRAAVWDGRRRDVYFQKAIHRVRFAEVVDSSFFVNALRASADDGRLAEYFTGTGIKHFTGAGLNRYLLPLPPLAEQHRIVAKVDELMALCDRLEAARVRRKATRDRLTTASLARLNAPDPEAFAADARFALAALPALTTRPDQIKQLRQTILSLAVRGKLVPQDANDEPASELLKRLKSARIALKTKGNTRKNNGSSPLYNVGEQGVDLPSGWSTARLMEIGQTQTGTSPSSANPDLFGSFIPFIKPSDLDGNQINYGGPGLSEIGITQSRLATENSIFMVCIGATLGKVNTTVKPVCFNQQINSLTPFMDGLTAFVALALKSTDFQILAWSKAGTGTLPIISKGKWEVLSIPLPPVAEQHRIVAKVDALITLCDQLEASLTAATTTRRRLLDALLAEALAPAADRLLEAAD